MIVNLDLEIYLLENFDIEKPNSIKELFKIQNFFNKKLIEIKKKEFLMYREPDFYDLRDCILDELQEFKKELPYKFNFKTYNKKDFSPGKLKEEFVDILNFILCKVLKNEDTKHFETAWNDFEFKENSNNFENISKKELDIALRYFQYWATEADFEMNYFKKIDINTAHSYLQIANLIGYSKNDIYEQYWSKFLLNCERYLNFKGE